MKREYEMTHKEPATDARSGTPRLVSAALLSTLLRGENERDGIKREYEMTHKEPGTDARSGTPRFVSAALLFTLLRGENEKGRANENTR